MRFFTAMSFAMMLFSAVANADEKDELIINPKLNGGLGLMPHIPTRIVNIDTMPPGWKPKDINYVNFKDIIPPDAPPFALLITGMVPDVSRRYVVAVTKDEAEFQRAYPEYKRLIAEGKYQEAGGVLLVLSSIGVSEKVESFWGHEKVRDMPEEVGSFFFQFDLIGLREHGGCLTFLSYRPKPGDDVVDYGYGLEDTIRGVLMIEEHLAADGGKPEYTISVIKATMIGQ